MKKDEWILTTELRRLNKFGIMLTARRVNGDPTGYYDLLYMGTDKIMEPSCSVSEIMGIINSLEQCINNFMNRRESANEK